MPTVIRECGRARAGEISALSVGAFHSGELLTAVRFPLWRQGHGSAFIRLHCDRLFAAGAPAIGTDPHPDNKRAIRAYEKAGFAAVSAPLETRWGRAVLMENWRGR